MPTINVRNKGRTGEQDIARDLNLIVYLAYKELQIPDMTNALNRVQRNQNQTAVGGCDLVGTFGLAIEIKRQEQLSINTWWAQCVASAKTLNEIPVLIFRQNNQKWRVIMPATVPLPPANWQGGVAATMDIRAEMDYETFKTYFKHRALRMLYDEAMEDYKQKMGIA